MNKLRYTIVLTALLTGGACASAQTPQVNGSVFGGGRMASVGTDGAEGITATVVINNSTIEEVYGGNDITGKVRKGTVASASVTVNSGTVGKVYGGGNGYYDYVVDGSTSTTAVKDKSTGDVVVTLSNTTTNYLPQIETTSVTIVNTSVTAMEETLDKVSNLDNWADAGTKWGIGEVFGGGNNADVSTGTSVTVNGGMIKYVFGGNNFADMETTVPDVYIKHGLIHSVYGGGNAGRMKGAKEGSMDYSTFISNLSLPTGIENDNLPYYAGTDVIIDDDTDESNTAKLLIGNVYGGCRAANVDNSTYVRVTRADTIGSVFGGCDIAGSVGLTPGTNMVYASTYVVMNGSNVKNIYGGGNGNYEYIKDSDNNVKVYPVGQSSGTPITTYNYYKKNKPFVTSSRLSVEGGTVSNNVYGGGNAAEVGHKIDSEHDLSSTWQDLGFDYSNNTVKYYGNKVENDKITRTSYLFLGKTTRSKTAPSILGNVYGGCCMANIYGTMDVIVKSGMNIKNLFAGNDASGTIDGVGRGKNQDHVSSSEQIGTMLYDIDRNVDGSKPWLSYGGNDLTSSNAGSYIRVERGATIDNLYGGGNGDYTYTKDGSKVTIKQGETTIGIVEGTYSVATDAKPTMAGTWVDMKGDATNMYGGGNAADVHYANAYIGGYAHITNAFGGGNSATVTDNATITVDCNAASKDSVNYNVKNLYGGNNVADMGIVPDMQIKCGKLGNIYGGGNAGNMTGNKQLTVDYSQFISKSTLPDGTLNTALPLYAGTNVNVVNASADNGLRIDNIYGGCRAANVDNSTYVAIANADYIGTVFGGCDIAGSVGMNPGDNMPYASTYVALLGGTVSGNMYASGNGNYQYVTENNNVKVYAIDDEDKETLLTEGASTKITAPYVSAGRLSVEGGTVEGNIYGGGLKAELGHVNAPGDTISNTSYLFFGNTSLATEAISIKGDVYGGGCLANVYGTMDIIVKAGVTLKNLYAGNDAAGNVIGTNRGSNTSVKSDLTGKVGTMLMDYSGGTSYLSYLGHDLINQNIGTYIRVEGAHDGKAAAKITNIFGGGNGAYSYTKDDSKVTIKQGDTTIGIVEGTFDKADDAKPVQKSTYLDIAGVVTSAYGGGNAANINTSHICIVKDAKVYDAYGGGNSATVTDKANIWVDCNAATAAATETDYNVWRVFGGNNLETMNILPTIYLQCGKIGTVYGGGNAGKMAGHDAFALDVTSYKDNDCLTASKAHVSEHGGKTYLPMFSATEVLVDSPYKIENGNKVKLTKSETGGTCGLWINTVYGGCKAADVDNSTYVRITRADYVGNVFAGNDIAGTIGMNPHTVSSETQFVAYETKTGSLDETRSVVDGLTMSSGTMVNSGSYVFVTGGTVTGNLFGGGNGDYTYEKSDGKYTVKSKSDNAVLAKNATKPLSASSFVGIEGGKVAGMVFGGGNSVAVGGVPSGYDMTANAFYNCSHIFIGTTDRSKADIELGSVFGGGNNEGIVLNTHISVDKGSVIKNTLYGGCNEQGTVEGDSKMVVHSGTIGTEGTTKSVSEDDKTVKYLADAVFGGGYGANTLVKGNVYVNINKSSDTSVSAPVIYGNVYGGGNAGPVNTDCNNVTETVVEGANLFGEVFGGGYGADVKGAIVLTVKDPTQFNAVSVTQTDASTTVYGNRVFATNNASGEAVCDATLNFEANSCDVDIFGGGNKAPFYGNTEVIFTKGTVGNIYGGGNEADVLPSKYNSQPGNTSVYVLGGKVCKNVFGGGKNGHVSGNASVYVLDDRLNAKGEYVVYHGDDGKETTSSKGHIAIDNDGTGLPYQPLNWDKATMQSTIEIGGSVYGGGENGNVGGKAQVHVGE